LSTKIHVAVRGLGCPVRLILTAAQRGDAPQAAALLGDDRPAVVLADAAYDADHFRARIEAAGATAVIPNNPSPASQRPFDEHLYKERHLIECFFSKLKPFRRIATRYEKTKTNDFAMVALAATIIWLR
jgi:transposase